MAAPISKARVHGARREAQRIQGPSTRAEALRGMRDHSHGPPSADAASPAAITQGMTPVPIPRADIAPCPTAPSVAPTVA